MSNKRIPNYSCISEFSNTKIPDVTFINPQYVDFQNDLKVSKDFGVTVHNFDDLNHYDDIDTVAALVLHLIWLFQIKPQSLNLYRVGTPTKL